MRIPARYNLTAPNGKSLAKRDQVWRVTEIRQVPPHDSYNLKLELRDGKATREFMHNSAIYRNSTVVDRWDFRRGDFATVRGYDRPFKLVKPLKNNEALTGRDIKIWTGGNPAWELRAETGRIEWEYEENLTPVEVHVQKKQNWTIKQDVES